jgi:hypothetical protein
MITPSERDHAIAAETAAPDHADGQGDDAVAAQSPTPVSSPSGDGGLGPRLDRLLRAAEQEALRVRESAERRAAAMLTEAHTEIARHEQERRREWQERQAALAAAEQRGAVEMIAAREQAAQLVAAAESEAERIRGRALLRAREICDAAEQNIEQGHREATADLDRLTRLRDVTRAEIVRLLRTLDGIREALAYDLDPEFTRVPAPEPGGAEEKPAAPVGLSAAVAAIGRRRGDLHRTRHSGLRAADADPPDHPDPG